MNGCFEAVLAAASSSCEGEMVVSLVFRPSTFTSVVSVVNVDTVLWLQRFSSSSSSISSSDDFFCDLAGFTAHKALSIKLCCSLGSYSYPCFPLLTWHTIRNYSTHLCRLFTEFIYIISLKVPERTLY